MKPTLIRDEETGLSDSKQRNNTESWYLEFTDKQVEALDLWEERVPGFWFSESTSIDKSFRVAKGNKEFYFKPDGRILMYNRTGHMFNSISEALFNE